MVYDIVLVIQDHLEVINKQSSKYHKMQSEVFSKDPDQLKLIKEATQSKSETKKDLTNDEEEEYSYYDEEEDQEENVFDSPPKNSDNTTGQKQQLYMQEQQMIKEGLEWRKLNNQMELMSAFDNIQGASFSKF